ncbi:hypothetical protein VP01_3590g1 [Puccinia sorghi]|uniref:Uncharacterized protein n=1 Tax=Puccinia sorghi TaxID=27349 RepID=A0A0L6UV95_9BASI|nr:hypothetical protein VP01_3590g1 [Puccinia sorghi]
MRLVPKAAHCAVTTGILAQKLVPQRKLCDQVCKDKDGCQVKEVYQDGSEKTNGRGGIECLKARLSSGPTRTICTYSYLRYIYRESSLYIHKVPQHSTENKYIKFKMNNKSADVRLICIEFNISLEPAGLGDIGSCVSYHDAMASINSRFERTSSSHFTDTRCPTRVVPCTFDHDRFDGLVGDALLLPGIDPLGMQTRKAISAPRKTAGLHLKSASTQHAMEICTMPSSRIQAKLSGNLHRRRWHIALMTNRIELRSKDLFCACTPAASLLERKILGTLQLPFPLRPPRQCRRWVGYLRFLLHVMTSTSKPPLPQQDIYCSCCGIQRQLRLLKPTTLPHWHWANLGLLTRLRASPMVSLNHVQPKFSKPSPNLGSSRPHLTHQRHPGSLQLATDPSLLQVSTMVFHLHYNAKSTLHRKEKNCLTR